MPLSVFTLKTLQVLVCINSHDLLALLDTGFTHNFINVDVASHVELPVSATGGLIVKVANGDKVSCAGRVPAVTINVDKETFNIDCYTISLDGYDVVLGVAILLTLGPSPLGLRRALCGVVARRPLCVLAGPGVTEYRPQGDGCTCCSWH